MKNTIKAIGKKLTIIPAITLGLLLGATAVYAGPPIPNTFTPGTPISSASVNANFANIEARLAALEAVTSTTISPATIAGTWGFVANNTTGGQFVPNLVDLAKEVIFGTIVVNAAGTFTMNEVGGHSMGVGLWNNLILQNVILPRTDGTFNTVAVAKQVDQKGIFNTSALPAASGPGTISIGTGNRVTLNGPAVGGSPLTGYISQNGQVMMLQGTPSIGAATTGESRVFIFTKIQ